MLPNKMRKSLMEMSCLPKKIDVEGNREKERNIMRVGEKKNETRASRLLSKHIEGENE